MKRNHVSTCIVIIFLFFAVFTIFGENGRDIIVPSGSTPTVDGSLIVSEWDDAVSVSVNGSHPVVTQVAFLKLDGKSLYVGLNVSDSTVYSDRDAAVLIIDVNHDGGVNPKVDDVITGVVRNGTVFEYVGNGTTTLIPSSVSGWSAATWNEENDMWTAEFNITYAKIGITSGEQRTLGIIIGVTDIFAKYDTGYYATSFTWPPGATGELGIQNWGRARMSPWAPEEISPFWMQWWFYAIMTVGIVALSGAVYLLNKKKPPIPTASPPPNEGTERTGTS